MPRRATGTIFRYVDAPPGEKLGHYVVRCTAPDGSRPLFDLDPSPKSEKAAARALEAAAAISERLRSGKFSAAVPKPSARRGAAGRAGETFEEWFGRWNEARQAAGLVTAKFTDVGRWRTHVAPVLGHLPMRALTRRDVEAFVETLDTRVRRGELAWPTAELAWRLVSKALNDATNGKALSLRVLAVNPAAGVRGPDRGDSKAKAYLYPSEFLQLMSCPDVPLAWRRAVAVSLYTYVRFGELAALSWDDLDLEHAVLHVHRQVGRDGEATSTKSGITRRVPIEPTLLPLLRVMHEECGGKGPVMRLGGSPKVAAGLRDHLRTAGLNRTDLFMSDATRRALRWHDLRASGITWMAVRGDDPLKIMRRAGHTSFDTTQLYLREAESLHIGFGEVFPPLPSCLLTTDPSGESDDGSPPSGAEAANESSRQSSRAGLRSRNHSGDSGCPMFGKRL